MKINRQTVHLWVSGQRSDITPTNLFKLSDALDADPRWLALGPVEPFVPASLSAAERRILEGYRSGSEKRRSIMDMMASPSARNNQLSPEWTRPDKRRSRVT